MQEFDTFDNNIAEYDSDIFSDDMSVQGSEPEYDMSVSDSLGSAGDAIALGEDYNQDGMPDFYVLTSDCDNDGIGDTFYSEGDTTGDGVYDAMITGHDADGDGLVDSISLCQDVDGDCQFDATITMYDSDNDGLLDTKEIYADWTGDGEPDFEDTITMEPIALDMPTGDSIAPDSYVAGNSLGAAGDSMALGEDYNQDGTPDSYVLTFDSDNDGIEDTFYSEADTTGDGVYDAMMKGHDTDGDGHVDSVTLYQDADGDGQFDTTIKMYDSDNDGLLDTKEIYEDWTGDGKPDFEDTITMDPIAIDMPTGDSIAPDSYVAGSSFDELDTFSPSSSYPENISGDPLDSMECWEFQGNTNRCALYSQKFVIEELTRQDIDIEEFADYAEEHGWFTEDGGTPFLCMDKMLDAYGVENEVGFHKDISDIESCLQQDGRVIVSLDSDQIWHNADSNVFAPECGADHAVEVIGIDRTDPEQPFVILNDSGSPMGQGSMVPLDVFEDAWESGNSHMVACYPC